MCDIFEIINFNNWLLWSIFPPQHIQCTIYLQKYLYRNNKKIWGNIIQMQHSKIQQSSCDNKGQNSWFSFKCHISWIQLKSVLYRSKSTSLSSIKHKIGKICQSCYSTANKMCDIFKIINFNNWILWSIFLLHYILCNIYIQKYLYRNNKHCFGQHLFKCNIPKLHKVHVTIKAKIHDFPLNVTYHEYI